MKQAGELIVNTPKAVIETGHPSLGTRMLFLLYRVLEPISPKKCRPEFCSLDDDTSSNDPVQTEDHS